MNDSAVFFLRHFNDTDHISPVIYALAKKGVPTRVVLVDPKLADHVGLAALEPVEDCHIVALHELLGRSDSDRAQAAVRRGDFELDQIIEGVGSQPAVCLDWDYRRFASRIVDSARRKKLVTVSLPHGDAPYVNLLINRDDMDGALLRNYEKATMYDHTLVPNSLCARRYPKLPVARLHVVGSGRYCQEWRAILNSLDSPVQTGEHSPVPRVVVFLRNFNFPVHWAEVERSLAMVAESGSVDLYIKHHTRAKQLDELATVAPTLAPESGEVGRVITDEFNSRELLRLADVVLDLGTSIAFEAVLEQVPVYELEYVHANRSTVAAFIPSSELRSRDDLRHLLKRLAEGDQLLPNRREARAFRKHVIEPRGRDVLGRITNLLLELEAV